MEAYTVGSRSIVVALVTSILGCANHSPSSAPPPCPVFNTDAITDYVRILQWEETLQIGPVNDLHAWMEDQMTYCAGIDAYRKTME